MNDSTPTMTLEELLKRTNAALSAQFSRGEAAAPFTERTLRYYVSQGLLPRLGTRGPGARYPESFVWRLLFIRRLQQERSLTLEMVRRVMDQVTPETMARVVSGEEPLEIASELDPGALRARVETGEEIVPLNRTSELALQQQLIEPTTGGDAADYLRRMRHRFDPNAPRPSRRAGSARPRWQSAWRDDRSEIRVRGDLTDAQRRQIENLGALLKSILED